MYESHATSHASHVSKESHAICNLNLWLMQKKKKKKKYYHVLDVDECAAGKPCSAGDCNNVPGSFQCACPPPTFYSNGGCRGESKLPRMNINAFVPMPLYINAFVFNGVRCTD